MGGTHITWRDQEFSWTRRILSEVHREFLQYCETHTELLKKDTKFKWTEECEASFQELKKRLVTTPVLIRPDQRKDYQCIATLLIEDLEQCLCRREELFHMPHDSLNLMSEIMLHTISS